MNIILFGEDAYTAIVLESLIKRKYKVLNVFSPYYKNKIYSKLKSVCINYKVKFERIKEFNSPEFVLQIKKSEVDLIIICHFKKIISNEIFEIPNKGCINIHPSLLPYYRGMSPQHYPIINGESETGVSVHFVDEGIDTGDIIVQKKIPILENDYVLDIQNRMRTIYSSIILEAIDRLHKNNFIVQKYETGSYYGKLKIADCQITTELNCQKAYNIIRAVSLPYLGARYKDIIIWRATIEKKLQFDDHIEIGTIIYNPIDTFIKFKDGYLKLNKFEKIKI